MAGHPHIDDIVVPQIDLRRAARSLNDHHIVLFLQVRQRRLDFSEKFDRIAFMVFPRRHISHGLSHEDDLGAGISRGF